MTHCPRQSPLVDGLNMSFNETNAGGTVSGDFSKLENLIKELGKKYYVDIGILGESNETVEGGLTLAGIGAVHEFGTDKAGRGNKTVIPERSFIRRPLETGQDDIEKQIKAKMNEPIVTNEEGAESSPISIKGIFKLIGIAGEARIKEAFASRGFGEWAENAESTIRQKGSDAPLIDEGALRDSIMSKVGVN